MAALTHTHTFSLLYRPIAYSIPMPETMGVLMRYSMGLRLCSRGVQPWGRHGPLFCSRVGIVCALGLKTPLTVAWAKKKRPDSKKGLQLFAPTLVSAILDDKTLSQACWQVALFFIRALACLSPPCGLLPFLIMTFWLL